MTLAVSILLMISNFGFGGFVGEMLAGMMEDIFGWAAYVLPFVLFGSVTFIISNRENPNAYVKVGAVLCLLALVCTFLELVDKKGGLLGELLAGNRGRRRLCGGYYPDDYLSGNHHGKVCAQGCQEP